MSYELVFEDNDSSDYNITKIGIEDSDATLTGYADGVAFAYTVEVGKTEASVPIKEDVTGPAVGNNVHVMNATYAWINKLTKVTITALEFVAREGAKYSGSGESVATEPTPREAYAPENFVNEGLNQEHLKNIESFQEDGGIYL